MEKEVGIVSKSQVMSKDALSKQCLDKLIKNLRRGLLAHCRDVIFFEKEVVDAFGDILEMMSTQSNDEVHDVDIT